MQDIVCGMVEGAHYCNFEVVYLRHVTNKKKMYGIKTLSVYGAQNRDKVVVSFSAIECHFDQMLPLKDGN